MKWLKPILFAFVFFNPIVLLILFKSYWIAFLIPLLIVVGGYFITQAHKLRLTVWLFNIFAIVGIALNTELVFRQLYSEKSVPNIYEVRGNYYFNKPYLNQRFDDEEFNSRYLTNCQGYRIDFLSNTKDSIKECDWLFLGDSFTQGAQVNYDEMFSSLLYRDFPDKIIVNAGMSGAGLYESLNYLRDEGMQLKPKRIFIQIGAFNDFYNIRSREAGWSEYLMEYSDLYRYLQYNLLDNPTLPLGRWTEPFFASREKNANFNIFFKESSDLKEKDREEFECVISQFKDEANKIGAELIILLVPTKEQISEGMQNEVMDKFGIKDSELDMLASNTLTSEVCYKYNIELIDLLDSFKSSDKFPFFMRDEHLNTLGHQLIANEISSYLSGEREKYSIFSRGNYNDRYPTIVDDGHGILFQTQEQELYKIALSDQLHNQEDVLWSSPKELIHPTKSKDGSWLAFTQGEQERGETDVVLFNFITGKDWTVNSKGYHAAIPAFSNDSKLIAYPQWRGNESPQIAIYDIEKKSVIDQINNNGKECWRPIFAPDDSLIYYIRMGGGSKFSVYSYNLSEKKSKEVLMTDYNIWDIAISPTGKYLAYAGNKDGNWDIFIYDLVSNTTIQVTKSLGDEWDPAFGITDDDLWFAGVFGINNGIYRMRLKL